MVCPCGVNRRCLILLSLLGAAVAATHANTVEASELMVLPQYLAQVVPSPAGTNTLVTVEGGGNRFEIDGGTQAGGNLFHRFEQFDLTAGQVANFWSDSTIEAIFSQVAGAASSIDGRLQVSGSGADLFVINPAGILLGPNARLDLSGSFTATTAGRLGFGEQWIDLLGEGFNGELAIADSLTALDFTGDGGAIANQGQLAVAPGEVIGLLGHAVVNTGSLEAPGGQVTLAAAKVGQRLSLNGGLLNVAIDSPIGEAANLPLQAAALGETFAEATGLQINPDGTISLAAGTTLISGEIDVSGLGETGGQVKLLGDFLTLSNTVVNASGSQGGEILVGGDYQGQGDLLRARQAQVDAASALRADAEGSSDGGRIVVWADGATQFAGMATATSQVGTGGLVETSGKQFLDVAGARVDASSLQGSPGEWLLDPTDISIQTGGVGPLITGDFDPATTGLASTIAPATIEAALDGGTNVTLTTASGAGGNGDILLNDPINQTGGGNASFTLTGRRFDRNGGAQINLTSTGGLTFNLNQVNGEANPSTQSIQNAIDSIGAVGGSRLITLGAGVYTGGAGTDLITIDTDLTLEGLDRLETFISGSNNARVVSITPGTTAALRSLNIQEGQTAASGAGILNQGNLSLNNVLLRDNSADLDGGAIDSSAVNSSLTTEIDTVILNNRAGRNGGGLALGGNSQIDGGGILGNVAGNDGGGLYNTGSLSLIRLGVSQNDASRGGAIANIGNTASTMLESFAVQDNEATFDGGGIFNQSGTIDSLNGSLDNNISGGNGGGLWSDGPTTLVNTGFDTNEAVRGGGAFLRDTTVDLRALSFLNNLASGDGGAIYGIQNNIAIAASFFSNNEAANSGGAIASSNSTVSIDQTTFTENNARLGGALQQADGSLAIADSDFFNNQAQTLGGGVDLLDVMNSTIERSLFQENQAGTHGGGISIGGNTTTDLLEVTLLQNQAGISGGGFKADNGRNFTGTINITDSSVSANRSGGNGAGLDISSAAPGGTLNLLRSTVSQNTAGGDGGGLALGFNTITNVTNSTIAQNQADRHGGGIVAYGNSNLTNATIADNQADADGSGDGQGGGLYKVENSRAFGLGNSLVAQNQASTAGDVSGTFLDQGKNLIGSVDGATGFVSSGLIGTDSTPLSPLLAPLDDYGGLTETMPLLPGSPAIDAGSSAIAADQRGVARVNAADIGAFESRGFVAVSQAGTPQSTEVNTAFAAPLVVGIASPFGEPVDGGQVSFAVSTSGASMASISNPTAVEVTGGLAQLSAIANGIEGSYDVEATVAGVDPVTFALTNVPAPLVQPPVTEPPVTELPVTELPVTEPPVTEPPVTEPPVTEPPVTEPPLPGPPLLSTLFERPVALSQPTREASVQSITADSPLSLVNEAAITAIDEGFSSAYSNYWEATSTEGGATQQTVLAVRASNQGSSVDATRELLHQAEEAHGAKSAVVYALFVPQDKTADEGFGSAQVASMALSRRAQTTEQRDDDQLMLILIPNGGAPVQQLVNVTRQELMQQGRLFRMAVSDPEDEWSYRPLAQQMQSWLFAPIEPEMARLELDNVMYALAPGLRTIPLAAMMDGDEFVIERYGISLIPSVDLLETNFGSSPLQPQTLAAGANEFELLEDLPAVEVELNAIANQRESVEVLFNQDFTLANLVATQNQSQAKMLHLATHAEFNAGDLGSSYLQFWDGRLTLDDIGQLGWNELELLILSACQTAISSPEAELGFAGLAAAAGVESTIGSLWSVSDVGTLGMMAEFYGQLTQEPLRFEALRQAQLAMRAGKTAIANQRLLTEQGDIELPEDWPLPEQADFSHPFYWSGFTLVGNPWW